MNETLSSLSSTIKKPSLCQITEKVINLQQKVERLRKLVAQSRTDKLNRI